MQEQIVQVGKVIPQERISERIVEEIGSILVPQCVEGIVEVVQTFPQERLSTLHCEVFCRLFSAARRRAHHGGDH